MRKQVARCVFVLAGLLFAGALSAQQNVATQAANRQITLDVVVNPKSGPPVGGLQQQDFTLLDNNVPREITSFQAVDGRKAPIRVILLIDELNVGVQREALVRQHVEKFLKAEGGHLLFPTAIAFLTETGLKMQNGSSSDGNALSASVAQFTVDQRLLSRSGGIYGAEQRAGISMKALYQLSSFEATQPGRKIVLWISPGWAFLNGPSVLQLDARQEQQIFTNVVLFSTLLRQAQITLYCIDPSGTDDFSGRASYWESYVKGISQPKQASPANLALQVIATQSGGFVLTIGNDIAAQLQKCLTDTDYYYEISFDPSPAELKDEYRSLEVRVNKPGMTARTRRGYYMQP